MLKKCVSSLLLLTLLVGCSSGTSQGASTTSEITSQTENDTTVNTQDIADQLIADLGLTDSMTQLKDRVVLGMFFNGDEDAFESGTVYLSSETGNSDTVGIFYTNNMESCKEYVNSYLENQKAQTQTYYPSEVFKISNAVVQSNDHVLVLIIQDDIESAKTKAQEILK